MERAAGKARCTAHDVRRTENDVANGVTMARPGLQWQAQHIPWRGALNQIDIATSANLMVNSSCTCKAPSATL